MFTTKQLAEKLGVSTKHVHRLFSTGRINPIDVGIGRRQWRVSQDELDRFMEGAKATEPSRRRKYVSRVL